MRGGCWGLVLVALCPEMALGEGRIDAIRREAAQPDDKPPPKRSDDRPSDPGLDEGEPGFGELFGEMLFREMLLGPFLAPRIGLHDEWDVSAYFPDYPYLKNRRGHLFFPEHDNGPAPENETLRVRKWSLRLSGEEGNDFRGMNRIGIRASVDTTSRFGLQSNWNFLSESLDGGRSDSTVLGDTNLTFRFAQSEKVQFHTGLGVRLLTDPTATHTGFNFLYGADFFPVKPWTISALVDLGNVGSSFILHGRATLGATWRHFEFYAGYDFMRIGSINVQGPMLGLRFWY